MTIEMEPGMTTTEEIVEELEVSIEAVYGDQFALSVSEDELGRVTVMLPPDERGPEGWGIAITPGRLPLLVQGIGEPPYTDDRFSQVFAKIKRWIPDPERLNETEVAELEKFRQRMRGKEST